MRAPLAPLALALAALPLTVEAAPFGPYSGAVVFGDSLSDPFVPYIPPTIYPEQQFTNGDTWAVQLGFDAASGTNFAQAGALARTNGDEVDDFTAQVETFAASGLDLGSNPLAYVWFGGNDVAGALESTNPLALLDSITTYGANLATLAGLGIENFVLFTVPDIGATPRVRAEGPLAQIAATELTTLFNLGLREGANLTESLLDVEIDFVDVAAVTGEILANPEAFGITNTVDPCFVPGVSFCGLDNADTYAYFDPFHPTEVIHAQFADAALAAAGIMAPVPLPAGLPLLGLGLGALALASRKVA